MLSRSNSNAADRLRRAKSNSSAHSNTSGHQRWCTTIDPFVTRRDAEAAALEAYHRARNNEQSAYQDPRPVPPKLQRRRSQTTGRSEGSHFEEARLGHRASLKRKDSKTKAKPAQRQTTQPTPQRNVAVDAQKSEGRVITKKRSVIPPASGGARPQQDQLSVTARPGNRKSQSSHTDGSPAPRHGSSIQQRSSTLQLNTPSRIRDDGYGGNLEQLSDFDSTADTRTLHTLTPPTDYVAQGNTEAIAAARDQCLRNFQEKKLDKRKSFWKLTFPKNRDTVDNKSSVAVHDYTIPPFNYAGDGAAPPSLPPEPTFPPPAAPETRNKSRMFSGSFKGRFKNVFRKSSRTCNGLPAQHLEAMNYHRTLLDRSPPVGFGSTEDAPNEPFGCFAAESRPNANADASSNEACATNSQSSIMDDDTARSRVTSWTNSTAAGTLNGRNNDNSRDGASVASRLQRSGSMSTLRRQTSSFFGRAMRDPLRRQSRQALKSSEESEKLFSALQQRMNVPDPSEDTSLNVVINGSPAPTSQPAIATLPSQQRQASTATIANQQTASTIRSVSPDPNAYKLGAMSPVTEVLSPASEHPHQGRPGSRERTPTGPPTFGCSIQRGNGGTGYTKIQLAQRLERAKNRWQSPLDEISPHPTRSATIDDNPYEMRSLSRNLLNESHMPINNDLPHHARVGKQPQSSREAVVSPSVYSQATNGASPRPDTPGSVGGTVITITGREVKRYSISPQKQPDPKEDRPIHASGDWRKWLSEELLFPESPAPDDFSVPKDIHQPSQQHSTTLEHSSDSINEAQTVGYRKRSPSTTSAPAPTRARRTSSSKPPTIRSRASSYMNDRYPMIDSSRNSSRQSVRAVHASSSGIGQRTGSSEQSSIKAIHSLPSKPVGSSVVHPDIGPDPVTLAKAEPIAKHRSMAQMRTGGPIPPTTMPTRNRLQSSSEDNAMVNASVISAYARPESSNNQQAKPNRPKSAFDLRANYKNSLSRTARPLEVRRKAQTSTDINPEILDDSTVLEITAGPYASPAAAQSGGSNKENHQPHHSSDDALPSLSSSEWLGGGPRRKRDLGKIANVASILPVQSQGGRASRHSPSRSTTYYSAESGGGGGKGSPGQQMASRFLNGRASLEEGAPAFV